MSAPMMPRNEPRMNNDEYAPRRTTSPSVQKLVDKAAPVIAENERREASRNADVEQFERDLNDLADVLHNKKFQQFLNALPPVEKVAFALYDLRWPDLKRVASELDGINPNKSPTSVMDRVDELSGWAEKTRAAWLSKTTIKAVSAEPQQTEA